MRRAFSLIELLVVIAIMAILAAVLFPVFVTAKSTAYQMLTVGYVRQLGEAELMYVGDHDDTFMPAIGADAEGYYAWFGRPTPKGTDERGALLLPYRGRKTLVDPTAKTQPYLGDGSGFGYNWGYIGSDISISGRTDEYPYCWYPARQSDLEHPSTTLVFATSVYYYAPWEGGDGRDYDYGFVDPNVSRNGNPNVAFRHVNTRRIEKNRVVPLGNSVVAMADGRARSASPKAFKDAWFLRTDPQTATSPSF